MEIGKIEEIQCPNSSDQIKELLFCCDEEFFPSLSSRTSSTQSTLAQNEGDQPNDGPLTYFQAMIKQNFIIAVESEELVGFLSYIDGYQNDVFEGHVLNDTNMYVSTICVNKDYRGQRIAHRLYDALEEVITSSGEGYISTRTWSTNTSHLKILEKRSFDIIETLKDHRGKGIDTSYFLKEVYSL
ncbi:GNAT family N-acetyltransferase [Lacticigenium naphthae]|uniref:GNAT family N-acetyltransferase n=1 Tax=Lacticigenium naphthae TaxID=515351 RepID=UPI0003F5581B|nr:GNAT family N-acetyltransferase [Lacticigenium naphthae]